MPGPGHDVVAGRRPGTGCSVESTVQVDIAVGAGGGADPARTAGGLPPGRAELDEDPGREPTRDRAQLGVGRLAQVGEQGGRGVRISSEPGGQRIGVELANLGGDCRKIGMPAG
ncbi:MAG: hypothetical protein ACLQFR_14670 [Streptosporangiaceae bacterium]